jgi:hypothetical protein
MYNSACNYAWVRYLIPYIKRRTTVEGVSCIAEQLLASEKDSAACGPFIS